MHVLILWGSFAAPFLGLVPTPIFEFSARKVVESYLIEQNVRNSNIYIRVMKQNGP